VPGLRLSQSHPNPFSFETTIGYELSGKGRAHLAIYDAAGRLVRVLADGDQLGGVHSAVWDGRNDRGGRAAAGVYFYRLRVDGASLTRQVLLMP
jgi:flagellar hook assembly protein FlgD